MKTNKGNKRFKWVFIAALLAVMVLAQFSQVHMRTLTSSQKGAWALGTKTLLLIPFGFVYGRNSARKDELGKLSRAFAYGAVICILAGLLLGRQWVMFEGLGIGYLAGYAIGWLAYRKSMEKYGDSLEADQYLNITRSEKLPKPQHPAVEFLKSQDKPTRWVLYILMAAELVSFLAGAALLLWPVFSDSLQVVTRALFVHAGDGTRFFITTDPIAVGVPLIMLSILASGTATELLLPILAGSRKETWVEYKTRRQTSPTSASNCKGTKSFLIGTMCISLLALILFMDSYIKITDEGIAINRFWGIGARHYHWSEVRDVEIGQEPYTCKQGHQHSQLRIRAIFTDGSEWIPDMSFGRRTPQIEAAAKFIAARKGL